MPSIPDKKTCDARIAVTGLGAVTAWGWGAGPLWDGLKAGRTTIAEARDFDVTGQRTRLTGEVPAAPAGLDVTKAPHWRRWSRADRFATAAAQEAWDAAALPAATDPTTVGVFFGGSTAAMAEAERFFLRLTGKEEGALRLSPLANHPLSSPGDAVARRLGLAGPVESLSSACASGALAVAAALEALRCHDVDVAVAGGSDSLCSLTYAGFNSLRAVDADTCSPFREQRAGLNLGEGAGVLVLEREADARARGAHIVGFVLGAGASCDAHHMTAPHPQGEGAARAIEAALDDAGVTPDDVTFVNAHGTGTPLNDRAEWHALEAAFGERAGSIPVTSSKALLGHFLGSSGAIEAVVTLLCLGHGAVHVTPGRGVVDPALGVDLVVDAMRAVDRAGLAVSTSFAFGGSNGALVLAGPSHGADPETGL